MNRQSGNKTGKLIYHYYKKRNASFLFNIYKAGITAKENDIHKARVDLKKMFALFDFFQMIGSNKFNIKEPQKVLNDVFKAAGNIREIQMNLVYAETLVGNDQMLQRFSSYLENNTKKMVNRFLQSIIKFDEKRLAEIQGVVKMNCKNIDLGKVIHKCDLFFQLHSTKIKNYRLNWDDAVKIHKIRQELKKISAIADLLNLLWEDEFMDNLVIRLNQAELLIGDWHDKIVFNKSLDQFFKINRNKQELPPEAFERIKNEVNREVEALLNKLLPEIDQVIILIAEIPFLRKAD